MEHKHLNDAERINVEILQEWLTGRGKQPVTWATLVDVLHDIGLHTLADEIDAVKFSASESISLINLCWSCIIELSIQYIVKIGFLHSCEMKMCVYVCVGVGTL